MGLDTEQALLLLLIAAVVAMLARKLRLPYTVGLILAGIGLAFVPHAQDVALTKQLIFSGLLPPLIFEAAFQIRWDELRKDLLLVSVLATLGVGLCAGLTAWGIRGLLHWPWSSALLVGVLLAATDPVAVLATFKESGVTGRLRLLVEAESLFNDGTAAVLFNVTLAATAGAALTTWSVTQSFVVTVVGGIACGLAVGGAALRLAGHTEDHLVEITFTTVAAYGSFLLAEHFHLSGVLATLSAGILMGNIGSCGAFTDKGNEAVQSFWEYIGFVANSLIFLLIGIRLPFANVEAAWRPALLIIVLVTLGRALAVYACALLFRASRARIETRHQHILFWGGLRGALALALVLGLPPDQLYRATVIAVVFAVVAFSVLVQGLTMSPLLRKLGLLRAE